MVYRLMPHLGVARAAPRPRIKYNKSKRYDDFNRRIGSSCYRVFQKVAFERRASFPPSLFLFLETVVERVFGTGQAFLKVVVRWERFGTRNARMFLASSFTDVMQTVGSRYRADEFYKRFI